MKLLKLTLLSLLAAIFIASPLVPLFEKQASAAVTATRTYSSMNADQQATSWWYYNALRRCVSLHPDAWNWAEQDVTSGNWFNGNAGFTASPDRIQHGYYARGILTGVEESIDDTRPAGANAWNDASTTCNRNLSELVKEALEFWGIPVLEMFCEIGARERRNGTECVPGNGDFRAFEGGSNNTSAARVSRFSNAIRDAVYGGANPGTFTQPLAYYYHLRTFMQSCGSGSQLLVSEPDSGTNNVYRIGVPDENNQIISRYVVGRFSGETRVATFPPGENTDYRSCNELASSTWPGSPYANAYQAAVAQNADYALNPGLIDSAGSGSGVSSCTIDGVGWIICPVSIALGKITDGAYAVIENFLIFQIGESPLDTSSNNTVYMIWSAIRNLANILFIFAFFAIILSQATSIGVSNYGIKRTLPRLIVAAIMVNLSYFLCVFAIDVSNVVGAGIDGIIKSTLVTAGPLPDSATWEKVMMGLATGTLLGAGVAAAAALGVIGFALPLAATALLAILVGLVILIGRQAILILLVIISPLAFVANILPNTDGLYKKWQKLFVALLVFYPLVAIMFSGSQVAASVLRAAKVSAWGPSNALIDIFSLAILAFPLFGLPWLLKFSGGALGRLAGVVNNRSKGLIDRARNKGKQMNENSSYQRGRKALLAERQAKKNRDYFTSMASRTRNRRKTLGQAGMSALGTQATRDRINNRLNGGEPGDVEYLSSRVQQNINEQYRDQVSKETARTLSSIVEAGGFQPHSKYRVAGADGSDVAVKEKGTDMRDAILKALENKNGTLKVENAAGVETEFSVRDIQSALYSQTAKMGDIPLTEQIIGISKDHEAAMREFIQYNVGNYATKAPDYVKGEDGAFKSAQARDIAGWHNSTAARAAKYADKAAQGGDTTAAENIARSLSQMLSTDEGRAAIDRQVLQNLVRDKDTKQQTVVYSQMSAEDRGVIQNLLQSQSNSATPNPPAAPPPPASPPPPSPGYL